MSATTLATSTQTVWMNGLQRRFSNRELRYIRNDEAERRQRASTAANSELSSGRRSTSETPACANSSALTSFVDAVANSMGCRGINS